jgi:hypothetical protein
MGEREVVRVNENYSSEWVVNLFVSARSIDLLEIVKTILTNFFKGRVFCSKIFYDAGDFYRCWIEIDFGDCYAQG